MKECVHLVLHSKYACNQLMILPMKLDTPIVTAMNSTTQQADFSYAGSIFTSFVTDELVDTISETMQAFVVEPVTQDAIQDIQNVLSVNLSDFVTEMSFGEWSFDYANGVVNLDVSVTPFNAADAVEITITAGI